MKASKAALALDCAITAEALQGGGDDLLDGIHAFCSEFYSTLSPLRQWITIRCFPIVKEG